MRSEEKARDAADEIAAVIAPKVATGGIGMFSSLRSGTWSALSSLRLRGKGQYAALQDGIFVSDETT